MYNIAFTAFPIMWFALFDFEKTKEEFMINPSHYSIGIQEKLFSVKIFWKWIIYSSW